jgi:Mg-chelatase subunit ChlD
MPAYSFDFATADGAQRVAFTLDDDRPLAPQLFQILEELRQRGLIIRGGPGEEIGAFWNGVDLDQAKTPQELGLSPARQIELRMRPAPSKAPPRPPEPPVTRFLAKGGMVAALAGFVGALIAWMIIGSFTDLGDAIDDYTQLDGVAALLFGACVGGFALAADALRSTRNVPLWAAMGVGLGAVGGALGALASAPIGSVAAGSVAPAASVAARVTAWTLLGGALGASLGIAFVRRDPRRVVDGLLFGFGGGAVGGLVYCFPGPSDLWQLIGFVVIGSVVAAALAAPALQRSAAIVELEGAHRHPMGVLTLREWGLDERTAVALRRGTTAAKVAWKGGRFAVLPSSADGAARVIVSGVPIDTPIYLRNGDVIDVAGARYRFRRLRGSARVAGSVLVCLTAGGTVARASAQVAGAPSDARLVRCAPGLDVPCLVTTLDLTPTELKLVAANDSFPAARMWAGRVAGRQMIGPTVSVVRETSVPFKLMILVDVSGSMRGEGLAFVRNAVRGFLRDLPERGVDVAVAPFESRRVAERIAGARFGTPGQAAAALEALPPPDPAGNTALYSALREGVVAVDRAVRSAGTPGTRGGVLLITDGRNDVAGRRDDRGLLSGPEGRTAASETARRSGQSLWIVGAGKVDVAELSALAGAGGRPYIIALNPILLTQSLTSVARQITTARALVFGVPAGSRVRLARARTPVVVRFRAPTDGAAEFTRLVPWRPPLYALPAYQGVADSTSVPGEVRAVMGIAGTDSARRWLLAVLFGVLAIVGAAVVPYGVWSAPATAAARAPAPAIAAEAPGAPSGSDAERASGLRRDVREAPPRKPDEITASSARRVKPS